MASLSSQFHTAIDSISAVLPYLPATQGEPPLSDPQALTREVSAAGFHQVTIHAVEYAVPITSLADYWVKIQSAAANVVLLRQRLGGECWA